MKKKKAFLSFFKTFSNRFMGRLRIYGHTSDGTVEKGRLCATGFSAAKDSQGGIIRLNFETLQIFLKV